MKLSVIIVSYNVKYYLEQCLLSVERAIEEIDAEIIVVDNASKDGSVDYIQARFPHITCISSLHNLGFACANNLAIRQCKGEYVLLLNPDTFVAEDTIRQSVSFMDTHPKAGGLGVEMLNTDGSRAMESRRGFPSPLVAFYKMIGLCKHFPTHPRFGHYYMSNMPWDKAGHIEVISGAYCMLRHEALDKVGLLDEDFFMYGEDIDLSYRVLKGGYENWYLPAKILHYKGESTKKSSYRYVHVFYDAMLIFFRKHYGGTSFLLSVPIKAAIYLHATVSLVRMLTNKATKMIGLLHPKRNNCPNYIFIGNSEAMNECEQIAKKRGITAQIVVGNSKTMPQGHYEWQETINQNKQNYIVYDLGAYTFSQVLNLFAQQPNHNVLIGTYNPQTHCIITAHDILTK